MVTTAESPIDSFLGFGVIRPFQRDASDFAVAGGAQNVDSAVGFVLSTEAQTERTQGELPWRPQFGSRLFILRHRKGAIIGEMARIFAREALALWEPRVTVAEVDTVFDRQNRVRSIKVRTNKITDNVPGNNVSADTVVMITS